MVRVYNPWTNTYMQRGSKEWQRSRKERLGFLQEMERLGAPEVTESRPYRAEEMTTPGEAYWRQRQRLEGRLGAAPRAPAVPSWLKEPWYQPWTAAEGQYGRWSTPENWSWYAPEAQLKGQPWAAIVNRMLPYMSPEDRPTVARQLYTAGGGAEGPFASYLQVGAQPQGAPGGVPAPPEARDYSQTLASISAVLEKIPDKTARDWAKSVFDVYQDWTGQTGMRTAEQEAMFKAQLEEMFAAVPEGAQPYSAALQRLVMPTVRTPAREWYEMPAYMRTAPTNWRALGYAANPAWM